MLYSVIDGNVIIGPAGWIAQQSQIDDNKIMTMDADGDYDVEDDHHHE